MQSHVFCYRVLLLFVLSFSRSSSRVYLYDVSIIQLRQEMLDKVRKQYQTTNT